MTAVDATQAVGKPMDLNAVMDGSPVKATRPGVSPKAEKSAFSFGDFIDVINPLQHIPGIAELYRSVTNDEISDNARKAGNALYGFALGGPVGLGAMLAYNEVGDRLNSSQEMSRHSPSKLRKRLLSANLRQQAMFLCRCASLLLSQPHPKPIRLLPQPYLVKPWHRLVARTLRLPLLSISSTALVLLPGRMGKQ